MWRNVLWACPGGFVFIMNQCTCQYIKRSRSGCQGPLRHYYAQSGLTLSGNIIVMKGTILTSYSHDMYRFWTGLLVSWFHNHGTAPAVFCGGLSGQLNVS